MFLFKETPTKMFSFQICEILLFSSFVLESLIILREASLFFLTLGWYKNNIFKVNFGKFIYLFRDYV